MLALLSHYLRLKSLKYTYSFIPTKTLNSILPCRTAKKDLMNTKNNEKNKTEVALIYILMIFMAIFYILLSLVICFLPAALALYLFSKNHNKLQQYGIDKNIDQEIWTSVWSAFAQISLYIAGCITFYKISHTNDKSNFSNLLIRISEFQSLKSAYAILLFVFLPCLAFYVMQIGDFFKDQYEGETVKCTKKQYYIMMIGTLFYPAIIDFGIKAKKLSWIISGIIYATPVIILKSLPGTGIVTSQDKLTVLSIAVMWVISLFHTHAIRNEYYRYLSQPETIRGFGPMKSSSPNEEQDEPKQEPKQEHEKQSEPKTNNTSTRWNSKNPFTVLAVSEFASVSEIKRAYYKSMNQYHPDGLAPEFREIAEEKSKILNSAYDECLKAKAV